MDLTLGWKGSTVLQVLTIAAWLISITAEKWEVITHDTSSKIHPQGSWEEGWQVSTIHSLLPPPIGLVMRWSSLLCPQPCASVCLLHWNHRCYKSNGWAGMLCVVWPQHSQWRRLKEARNPSFLSFVGRGWWNSGFPQTSITVASC